ncbi:MAG TPA: dihydroorotase [Syntrophomonadaceae bacterium]|nr:dihydroorotase [Syntrophomonadaceae bacterium]HQE22588.1 dihydroorotase [Syntrophomonadaceae bacterium]
MKLLVKGGRVIDPASGTDQLADVLIQDGKVIGIEPNISIDEGETLDASGKLVCPGFIDIHVHLREPGFEYKEDIASGTRAAAVGGFTTICCMPNTNPVMDNAAVASFVRERAQKSGVVHVFPIGAVTRKQEGNELAEIAELVAAGCIALSDDGRPVTRADIMRYALEYSKMFEIPLMSHCEDLHLSQGGQMHEGYFSTIYGLKGIPAEAEEVMVARDLLLARLTGAHLHLCHISTAGSIQMIRRAKSEGIRVTCEVTPHHLTLTDEIVGSYDTDTKVNPPLRSQEHLEVLRSALQDGTIDCIATDHAPHHFESKDCEYELAATGISGLETAIPVVMSLVKQGILDLKTMIEKMSLRPAQVLGLDRGRLQTGAVADLTIIDPDAVRKVDPARFYSQGKNTPFKGFEYTGWPFATIVAGKIVARDGIIV